jgi:hypothetical protein
VRKITDKWHKNCGGKVVYQKPLFENTTFDKAGFCLRCKQFPIDQEDIIFKVEGGYERLMYNGKWDILTLENIQEELEGTTKLKDLSKYLKKDFLKETKEQVKGQLIKTVGPNFSEELFEEVFQKTIKSIDKDIQNNLKNAMINWRLEELKLGEEKNEI